MHYAFLDESGDVSLSGSRHLAVAALVTAYPRQIELRMKRMYRALRRRPKVGEMKAAASEPGVVERLLRILAQESVAIVSVVVDKACILRPPQDVEDIYRMAVARAVQLCVERWTRLTLYLDKRYTQPKLRDRLEEAIRERLIETARQMVIIRQVDSFARKEIQAADHVAWSVFQKHENGNDRFCRIIEDRVVAEQVIKQELW